MANQPISQFPLKATPDALDEVALVNQSDLTQTYKAKVGTLGGSYVRNGTSVRFNELVNVNTVEEALDQVFNFVAVAKSVSLATIPAIFNREKGLLADIIANVTLNSTVANGDNNSTPIASLVLEKNNVVIPGAYPVPVVGLNSYDDIGANISDTTSYKVTVTDGVGSNVSTRTYNFFNPFIYHVGNAGLSNQVIYDQAQINTTKLIKGKSNSTISYTTTSQVQYFGFPASFGNLAQILDPSNFDITADWTVTDANVTMDDGSVVLYKMYEFNNLNSNTNFSIKFNF